MSLVLGLILGHLTNSIHQLLSSNIVQCTLGNLASIGDNCFHLFQQGHHWNSLPH